MLTAPGFYFHICRAVFTILGKYFYFERYSGVNLDMCLNFVVRELDGCGGEQVSPFSYGIKEGKWEDGEDSGGESLWESLVPSKNLKGQILRLL